MNISISKSQKRCPKCKIIKSREDFYKLKGQLIKVNSYCKPCLLKSNMERRKLAKQQAIDYRGGCCSKCGYNKCLAALDFHHRNPSEKDKTWRNSIVKFTKKVKAEVDKCDILCANCHREFHANENIVD